MTSRPTANRSTGASALTPEERRTLRAHLPAIRSLSPDAAAIIARLLRSSAAQRAPNERYATVAEVATTFGVSDQTIRNWVDRGLMPGTRAFGSGPRRIPREVMATAEAFQQTAGLPVPELGPDDVATLLAPARDDGR